MATGNSSTSSMIQTQSHAPHPSQHQSPPNKRDLASWWNKFKKTKKEEEKGFQIYYASIPTRFRDVDADGPALPEMLELAKVHGDCAPSELHLLVSEQDHPSFGGESGDGESPMCC
ncbi:MAG: hypothetical protein M1839_004645 [Geoglossum umbratile]|nr:MAG: hypothetical protein M1839_004645 [Geoglossum umbratile]